MFKISTKHITIIGVLTALSIILERFIGPMIPPLYTDSARFSLGNIPIIICSLSCGVIPGAICGLVSDILGCFISGYAPYPALLLAPVLTGILPWLIFTVLEKIKLKNCTLLNTCIIIILTNSVASVFWTTLGLSWMYGTTFSAQFILRFHVIILTAIFEIIIIYALLKSKIIERTAKL
jgi:ECF transporter S component (folate family)